MCYNAIFRYVRYCFRHLVPMNTENNSNLWSAFLHLHSFNSCIQARREAFVFGDRDYSMVVIYLGHSNRLQGVDAGTAQEHDLDVTLYLVAQSRKFVIHTTTEAAPKSST